MSTLVAVPFRSPFPGTSPLEKTVYLPKVPRMSGVPRPARVLPYVGVAGKVNGHLRIVAGMPLSEAIPQKVFVW